MLLVPGGTPPGKCVREIETVRYSRDAFYAPLINKEAAEHAFRLINSKERGGGKEEEEEGIPFIKATSRERRTDMAPILDVRRNREIVSAGG